MTLARTLVRIGIALGLPLAIAACAAPGSRPLSTASVAAPDEASDITGITPLTVEQEAVIAGREEPGGAR